MPILTVLLLSAGLSAVDGPAEQAKQELERLQGEWVMAALEVDGKMVPEEKLRGTTLLIKADKYINAQPISPNREVQPGHRLLRNGHRKRGSRCKTW